MFEVSGNDGRGIHPWLVKRVQTFGQILWQPLVVSIEKSDKFAVRFVQATITGGTRPGIFLPDDTQTRIGKLFNARQSAVSRPVIDNNNFKVGKRLGRDGAQRPLNERRFVEERNDDGDAHD